MDAVTPRFGDVARPVGCSGRLGSYAGLVAGNLALTVVTLGN
jgi:hypothetical protein